MKLIRVLRLLRDIFREIFEEAAYERFCRREGLPPGRESYGRFLRQASASAVKVKCC